MIIYKNPCHALQDAIFQSLADEMSVNPQTRTCLEARSSCGGIRV